MSPRRLFSCRFAPVWSAIPLAVCLPACSSSGTDENGTPSPTAPNSSPSAPNSNEGAPSSTPPGPRPALCSRTGDDAIRDLFCKRRPAIGSLQDLEDSLAVPYDDGHTHGLSAFMGHSTSLSARVVSPINPRVIMTTMDPSRPGDRTLLAFVRGEQQVEIAARDRGRGTFNLYLLTFEQRCNALPAGCLPGDLFTPAIESAWTHVELRDDEDLKNTPLDCRQCHQRGRQSPILLMRELQFPWTHFFEAPADTAFREPNGGMALERAYERAKGDEAYANFSSSAIAASSAEGLEGVVTAEQPLVFDSQTILDERLPSSAPAGSPPERSPTWDREYETFKLGEHLALPYFDADPTDPDKLGALTTAYRSYLAGSMPAADLPDLADVFPDDPHVRAQIGLQTEPDATPAEVLVQACCPCHDDVLDQSISRARFNVALSRLDADELTVAVDRLRRSREEAGAMPAPAARQLDSAARTRLIEYLESGAFSNADLDMLAHAAQAGMSGNAQ